MKLNRPQLRGIAPGHGKQNKPSTKPPATALNRASGKPLDDALENPRAYLGAGYGEEAKCGYTKIVCDLDPHDRERNPLGGIDPDDAQEDDSDDGNIKGK